MSHSVSPCVPHLPFNTHIHAHRDTHAHTLTQSYTLIYSERVLIFVSIYFVNMLHHTNCVLSLSIYATEGKKGVFTPPYLSYITTLKIPHMRVMIVFYHCESNDPARAPIVSTREPGLPRAPCLSQIDMGE